MTDKYNLYNVDAPVKVKIGEYNDLDSFDVLQAIIIHTSYEEGNEQIAVYDPKRLYLVPEFPELETYEGDITYKLPFSQIKDIDVYALLGFCKALKIVWEKYDETSKLVDEILNNTKLQIKTGFKPNEAQITPSLILPRVKGDHLLITDKSEMFEELEKLENIIFDGEFEEEKKSIIIHFII